jgi:hypothetical protein
MSQRRAPTKVSSGTAPVAWWRVLGVRRPSTANRTFRDGGRALIYAAAGSPPRAGGSAEGAAPGHGARPRATPHEAGAGHDASNRNRRNNRDRGSPGRDSRGPGRCRLDRRAGNRADHGDPGRAALVVPAALAVGYPRQSAGGGPELMRRRVLLKHGHRPPLAGVPGGGSPLPSMGDRCRSGGTGTPVPFRGVTIDPPPCPPTQRRSGYAERDK